MAWDGGRLLVRDIYPDVLGQHRLRVSLGLESFVFERTKKLARPGGKESGVEFIAKGGSKLIELGSRKRLDASSFIVFLTIDLNS